MAFRLQKICCHPQIVSLTPEKIVIVFVIVIVILCLFVFFLFKFVFFFYASCRFRVLAFSRFFVYPSVRRSVRPSVGPSVGRSVIEHENILPSRH